MRADLRSVRTLREANEVLGKGMPGPGSSASARAAFHRRAERVYRDVAMTDRDHHHEAMAWASIEKERAEKAEKELREEKRAAANRKARKEAAELDAAESVVASTESAEVSA
ncbi:AMED_5909 family protein [Actinokineospora sp.]|uniref:AMED_5909 family protein n=1 Tax=Actinokineospora sp. TaxID=1872133 RepID=UPI003D6C1563